MKAGRFVRTRTLAVTEIYTPAALGSMTFGSVLCRPAWPCDAKRMKIRNVMGYSIYIYKIDKIDI